MHSDIKKILIDEKQIQAKTKELGQQIMQDYKGKDLLVICVLKGAVLFMSDLVQHIEIPLEMDFMAVSSYGNATHSSGEVRIIKDLDSSIENKDLLIVEDIVDSGLTLNYLVNLLKSRGVKSLKICSLLEKPDNKVSKVHVDYIGFQVPDEFVVGYGLDYAQKYRNLPYIGVLKENIYK